MNFPSFHYDPFDRGFIVIPDETGNHRDTYIAELCDEDEEGQFEPDPAVRDSYGRLLAAAPELLAKLEALANAASVVNVFLDATPAHRTADIYNLRNCIEQARAAIAKAKGNE